MKAKTFRIGGVHPEENKLTHEAATQVAALPKGAKVEVEAIAVL